MNNICAAEALSVLQLGPQAGKSTNYNLISSGILIGTYNLSKGVRSLHVGFKYQELAIELGLRYSLSTHIEEKFILH